MSARPRAKSPTASLTATTVVPAAAAARRSPGRSWCRCGPGRRRASPARRLACDDLVEVVEDAGLAGLVVVRRDQQQRRRRRASRPGGRARRSARWRWCRRRRRPWRRSPTASLTAAQDLAVLGDAGGRRLAGGAGDDDAVVAVVDEVRGDPRGAVEVDRAVVVERRWPSRSARDRREQRWSWGQAIPAGARWRRRWPRAGQPEDAMATRPGPVLASEASITRARGGWDEVRHHLDDASDHDRGERRPGP